MNWRAFFGAAIGSFLALQLIAFVGRAHAADELYFDNGTTAVTLTQKPCAIAAAASVLSQLARATPMAAAVRHQGRDIAACWSMDGDKVLMLDEDGDGGFMAAESFSATRKPVAKPGVTL